MAIDRRSFEHELWHVPGAHHCTQRHSYPHGAHNRECICAYTSDRIDYFPHYLSRRQAALAVAGKQIPHRLKPANVGRSDLFASLRGTARDSGSKPGFATFRLKGASPSKRLINLRSHWHFPRTICASRFTIYANRPMRSPALTHRFNYDQCSSSL